MVTFSCDGCATIIKKSQVDTHAYRCRSCTSVSCVDCGTSFPGDTYSSHTTCLTEAEHDKATPRSQSRNVKLTATQHWQKLIIHSLSNAPDTLRPYLQQLTHYDNVPRKETQFRNYCPQVLKLPFHGAKAEECITALWKYLIDCRTNNTPKTVNPEPPADPVEPTKESLPEQPEPRVLTIRDVCKRLRRALKKAPHRRLSLKKVTSVVKERLKSKHIKCKGLKAQLKECIGKDRRVVLEDGVVILRAKEVV